MTPTSSVPRAAGIKTRHVFCRRVQPTTVAKSCTVLGTSCNARVVALAIGGIAKITVAIKAETGPKPKKISTGTR